MGIFLTGCPSPCGPSYRRIVSYLMRPGHWTAKRPPTRRRGPRVVPTLARVSFPLFTARPTVIPSVMSSFKKRYHRFVTQKGFQIIQRIERFIGARSLVGDRPFFDPDRFAWTQRLEARTDVIQGELGRVLQHRDHLPNFQDISEDSGRLRATTGGRPSSCTASATRPRRTAPCARKKRAWSRACPE